MGRGAGRGHSQQVDPGRSVVVSEGVRLFLYILARSPVFLAKRALLPVRELVKQDARRELGDVRQQHCRHGYGWVTARGLKPHSEEAEIEADEPGIPAAAVA